LAKQRLGNKRCCSRYFKNYLLTEIKEPIVLGLDEVDRIFQEKIATDFFGLLRMKMAKMMKPGKDFAS